MKFWQSFNKIANKKGNEKAIISITGGEESVYSYTDLKNNILRIDFFLKKKKINNGKKILCLLPNSAEMLTIFLTTFKRGLIFCPLPCNINEDDLLDFIKLAKPDFCFFSNEINNNLKKIVSSKIKKNIKIDINNNFKWLQKNKNKDNICYPNAKIYLKTSGTTGKQKIMIIDSNTLWESGLSFIKKFNINPYKKNTFWNFLPMSYLGGLYNLGLIPISIGSRIIIDDNFSGKTFIDFWNKINQFNINILWLVPSIVKGLIEIFESNNYYKNIYKKIDFCFLGTAPINIKIKEKFTKVFNIKLLENFALSETTFISTENPREKSYLKNYKGIVLDYVKILIDKKHFNKKFGEILVKSKFIFDGYLSKNGIEIFKKNKYFKTGDLGYKKGKKLFIIGRIKEIIKKGGVLINLNEIEDKLKSKFSFIDELSAIKIPHNFYMESYELKISLKNKYKTKNNNNFRNKIIKYLQKDYLPEKIIFVNKIPKTSTGKIQRFK